jgi:hypothetical protein
MPAHDTRVEQAAGVDIFGQRNNATGCSFPPKNKSLKTTEGEGVLLPFVKKLLTRSVLLALGYRVVEQLIRKRLISRDEKGNLVIKF